MLRMFPPPLGKILCTPMFKVESHSLPCSAHIKSFREIINISQTSFKSFDYVIKVSSIKLEFSMIGSYLGYDDMIFDSCFFIEFFPK